MNHPAIEAHGLTKSYGDTVVARGIDLTVPAGGVVALLGPNGAGKTTTVRMLATLTAPDAGTARVAGYDIVTERHEVRRRISLTGQSAAVDELQTGFENLVMMGRLRRLSSSAARGRAHELLARFDLTESGQRRIGTYSGGMRRRLDLAVGLVTTPEVVFLDEPTTGLDPRSRQALWDVVTGLAADGVAVLLTTQYLEEADHLADRIVVVDGGRIVAEGTAAELKSRVGGHRLDLVAADAESFDLIVGALGHRAGHVDRAALAVGVSTDGTAIEARRLLDHVDPGGGLVSGFTIHTTSLDDVFMALTGDHAHDDRNENEKETLNV